MVNIFTYKTGIYENDERLILDEINVSRRILKISGIIFTIPSLAIIIIYIVLITLGNKSGNENYNMIKNCTVVDPLIEISYDQSIYMRLGKLYISWVKYDNPYTNSSILAETMAFSMEQFKKYNYTKNDNTICYISKENYFTVYYYETWIYSNKKIQYYLQAHLLIIGIFPFIAMFIFILMLERKKIINLKKDSLNYEFNYYAYQNVL